MGQANEKWVEAELNSIKSDVSEVKEDAKETKSILREINKTIQTFVKHETLIQNCVTVGNDHEARIRAIEEDKWFSKWAIRAFYAVSTFLIIAGIKLITSIGEAPQPMTQEQIVKITSKAVAEALSQQERNQSEKEQ